MLTAGRCPLLSGMFGGVFGADVPNRGGSEQPTETAQVRLLDVDPEPPGRYRRFVRGLLSGRLLAVGFAAGLLVASAGLAIAHGPGTSTSGAAESSSVPAGDESTPAVGPEALGFVPEQEWRESHGLPPLSAKDEVDFAMEGPIPWIAEACRKEGPGAIGSTALHCDAVIAITEGRMEPGIYSDAQLRAELGE